MFRNAYNYLLALCLGVSLGGAQGTILEIELGVNFLKEKCSTYCIVSPMQFKNYNHLYQDILKLINWDYIYDIM